jgi:hypothetical protein
MGAELAVIECDPAALSRAIRTAALATAEEDPYTEMFVRIAEDGIDTPARSVDAPLASFCTLHPSLFEEFTVSESTAALFPIEPMLDWLDYFAEESSLTLTVVGEAGAEYASAFRFESDRRRLQFDCVDAPELIEDVDISLPDRFADTQFLDESGEPVPTTVETTAAELDRLIEAVSRCTGVEGYPLSSHGEGLSFEVTGERTTVSGTLAGTVDGPDCQHRYGSEFARSVRAVEGQVTLQTGPDHPLAVHCTDPGVTYRYVLTAHS